MEMRAFNFLFQSSDRTHYKPEELELINVTMADAGRYTCIAKNSVGQEFLSQWLFVEPGRLSISLKPEMGLRERKCILLFYVLCS